MRDDETRLLVRHMQEISAQLGTIHPSRGCIGCGICSARNMLEGMSDGPACDIIIGIRDEDES